MNGTQPRAGAGPLADGQLDLIDAFIDPQIRLAIEQTYYARINAQCSLAAAMNDPSFVEDPGKHVAVFADHGIVHARDVATQVLAVLDAVHGVLIPRRDPARLGWMKAYGVLVAFVHDIGMVDLSPVGRAMHPEFATQALLGPAFDHIMTRLWATDRGGFAGRLRRSAAAGHLTAPSAEAVAREMLAMANCHSKSKVPVALLNEPAALRRMMHVAATTDLGVLHARQREAEDLSGATPAIPRPEGFAWLEASGAPGRALVDDVIDTLRVLRCADALRQRGTVLKTSGNYEVFVDRRSANAVFAFRPDARHLFLLELPEPIAAGEANLAGSQLDSDGNLRISFHRGMFRDEETGLRAARSAALIVNDIQADAIGSFVRGDVSEHSDLRPHAEVRILIEPVDDDLAFAGRVRDELAALNPTAAERVRLVPAGRGRGPAARVAAAERDRVRRGSALDWDPDRTVGFLRRVQQSGHRADRIDPVAGFRGVRRIELRSGERLIEAGTASDFVYIALGEGLRGRPLGGYDDFPVRPWIPIGVTGVIRGAARNAEIRAEQDVALIAIPADVFLDHWHFTYDRKAFAELLAGLHPQADWSAGA